MDGPVMGSFVAGGRSPGNGAAEMCQSPEILLPRSAESVAIQTEEWMGAKNCDKIP